MRTGTSGWVIPLDLDAYAFYAAVEQQANPALRGRALVVGAHSVLDPRFKQTKRGIAGAG